MQGRLRTTETLSISFSHAKNVSPTSYASSFFFGSFSGPKSCAPRGTWPHSAGGSRQIWPGAAEKEPGHHVDFGTVAVGARNWER